MLCMRAAACTGCRVKEAAARPRRGIRDTENACAYSVHQELYRRISPASSDSLMSSLVPHQTLLFLLFVLQVGVHIADVTYFLKEGEQLSVGADARRLLQEPQHASTQWGGARETRAVCPAHRPSSTALPPASSSRLSPCRCLFGAQPSLVCVHESTHNSLYIYAHICVDTCTYSGRELRVFFSSGCRVLLVRERGHAVFAALNPKLLSAATEAFPFPLVGLIGSCSSSHGREASYMLNGESWGWSCLSEIFPVFG